MQFLGPPFTFGINAISEGITIAGPLSAIAVEDNVFWMGGYLAYVDFFLPSQWTERGGEVEAALFRWWYSSS